MTLGILVTRDEYKEDIVGLAKAALSNGHKVIIFMMDEGCLLSTDSEFTSLKDINGVTMTLCDFSLKRHGLSEENVPEGITRGSQYNNAVMNHDSDKVVVF